MKQECFDIIIQEASPLKRKIKLDKPYENYVFRLLADSQILVQGYGSNLQGTVWDIVSGKAKDLTDTFNRIYPEADVISLNHLSDKSEGWAKRMFVFGNQAYQRKTDGSMVPVFNGASLNISVVAFSPDGKLIEANGGQAGKGINIRDANDKILDSIKKTGNTPAGIEFSPDGKMLLGSQSNFLQLYNIKILKEPAGVAYHLDPAPQELRFSSYALQHSKFHLIA